LQHKTAVACVFQHLVFGTGANHYLLAFWPNFRVLGK
jgi:hypothetical protein